MITCLDSHDGHFVSFIIFSHPFHLQAIGKNDTIKSHFIFQEVIDGLRAEGGRNIGRRIDRRYMQVCNHHPLDPRIDQLLKGIELDILESAHAIS